MSKIGLGTAQLGQDYGVANTRGRPSDDEARSILRAAWDGGVRVLDTAPAYGDSEARIAALAPAPAQFRVVTKTRHQASPADLREDLERSLARLEVAQVHGLLVHEADVLSRADASAWVHALAALRGEGLVHRIGVSVYTAAQARAAIRTGVLDLIQVPVSVLDQRLVTDGTLARLRDAGFEVHARSVLLQGLLVQDPDAVRVPGARAALAAFRYWCRARRCSPLQAALGFVTALPEIDVVLVGVDEVGHLQTILEAARYPLDPGSLAALALRDEHVLNPSLWEIS